MREALDQTFRREMLESQVGKLMVLMFARSVNNEGKRIGYAKPRKLPNKATNSEGIKPPSPMNTYALYVLLINRRDTERWA